MSIWVQGWISWKEFKKVSLLSMNSVDENVNYADIWSGIHAMGCSTGYMIYVTVVNSKPVVNWNLLLLFLRASRNELLVSWILPWKKLNP